MIINEQKKKIKKEDKNMTKRMKRIAALLTCGLVLASGTSVYAGNAEGTLLGYPISLEVSVRKASAMTAGSYPKTTIYPYRYATGGSANQLIPMTAVSGAVRRAFMLLMDGILERQKVCMKMVVSKHI